jgi:predicted transcriptional regulator
VTPLLGAIYNNSNPEVTSLLIRARADMTYETDSGASLLMLASRYSPSSDVIKSLIRAGFDVNAGNGSGVTPLMYAANFNTNANIIDTLVEAGADINISSKNGRTPLIYAIKSNSDNEVALALLDAKADIDVKDSNGKTVRQLAQDNESIEHESLLYCRLNPQDFSTLPKNFRTRIQFGITTPFADIFIPFEYEQGEGGMRVSSPYLTINYNPEQGILIDLDVPPNLFVDTGTFLSVATRLSEEEPLETVSEKSTEGKTELKRRIYIPIEDLNRINDKRARKIAASLDFSKENPNGEEHWKQFQNILGSILSSNNTDPNNILLTSILVQEYILNRGSKPLMIDFFRNSFRSDMQELPNPGIGRLMAKIVFPKDETQKANFKLGWVWNSKSNEEDRNKDLAITETLNDYQYDASGLLSEVEGLLSQAFAISQQQRSHTLKNNERLPAERWTTIHITNRKELEDIMLREVSVSIESTMDYIFEAAKSNGHQSEAREDQWSQSGTQEDINDGLQKVSELIDETVLKHPILENIFDQDMRFGWKASYPTLEIFDKNYFHFQVPEDSIAIINLDDIEEKLKEYAKMLAPIIFAASN